MDSDFGVWGSSRLWLGVESGGVGFEGSEWGLGLGVWSESESRLGSASWCVKALFECRSTDAGMVCARRHSDCDSITGMDADCVCAYIVIVACCDLCLRIWNRAMLFHVHSLLLLFFEQAGVQMNHFWSGCPAPQRAKRAHT